MIRKVVDLPPKVARGFVDAMNDYFAEESPTKRDAIAAHQLRYSISIARTAQRPVTAQRHQGDVRGFEGSDFVGEQIIVSICFPSLLSPPIG
jgi:hypothetical protein